jgi:outer membrane protein insertion porin family
MVGYSLSYNTLDNGKNPTDGIYAALSQDVAGAGGDSKFVRTTGDARYYHSLFLDGVVGIVHLQGGDIFGYGGQPLRIVNNFNLGPSLVRGFAPGGIGPRDISDPFNTNANSLGGTKYVGASTEVQFPIWGMPKEVGLKGAIYADAGTLFGYEGQTNFNSLFGMLPSAPCSPAIYMLGSTVEPKGYIDPTTHAPATPINQGSCIDLGNTNTAALRSSVGVGLLWASPLGPIRFNYSFVLSKSQFDVTQAFSFSGGSSF